jgi:hypothetical protein
VKFARRSSRRVYHGCKHRSLDKEISTIAPHCVRPLRPPSIFFYVERPSSRHRRTREPKTGRIMSKNIPFSRPRSKDPRHEEAHRGGAHVRNTHTHTHTFFHLSLFRGAYPSPRGYRGISLSSSFGNSERYRRPASGYSNLPPRRLAKTTSFTTAHFPPSSRCASPPPPYAPVPPHVPLSFRNPENRRTFRLRANPARPDISIPLPRATSRTPIIIYIYTSTPFALAASDPTGIGRASRGETRRAPAHDILGHCTHVETIARAISHVA